jgi:hypothetical protein
MKKKTYQGRIQFKADADQTGEFSAEFATLDVIDHDRDVTRPGAFHEQETLIEAWNHGYGDLPVGKGMIREQGGKAIIDGRFFLDTAGGQEHYKVVKHLGDLQQWSYTFEIEKSSLGQFDGQDVQFLEALDVWGVAPVQRGAGINTRTTLIKDRQGAEIGAAGSANDADGEEDTTGEDEGQGGDVEPSGPPPGVVRTGIEIELLEV